MPTPNFPLSQRIARLSVVAFVRVPSSELTIASATGRVRAGYSLGDIWITPILAVRR